SGRPLRTSSPGRAGPGSPPPRSRRRRGGRAGRRRREAARARRRGAATGRPPAGGSGRARRSPSGGEDGSRGTAASPSNRRARPRPRAPRGLGPVRGEVDGRVESTSGQEAGKVLGGPVAPEPLHPGAEGIGEPAAVEEGDPVAGGQEPPDQLVADEPGAADDEDVHGGLAQRCPGEEDAPAGLVGGGRER